jgi:bacteriocin biosynthesis cyclodehydratase domain-containing protein
VPSAEREVTVLAVGSFGLAVGEFIRELGGNATICEADGDGDGDPVPPGTGPIVVAMLHEREKLCHRVERFSLRDNRPWLPVFVDSATVRAGPLVVPGSSACYLCFCKRRAQHDAGNIISALARAERARRDAEARFRHHARIAASLAWRMLRREGVPADRVDRSRQSVVMSWDTRTAEGRTDTVLSCHDCPRCRPEPAARREIRDLFGLPGNLTGVT